MGIKFYCPDCQHKLNVKEFLAGKQGICPHCTKSIKIPKESTRGRGAKKSGEAADEEPETTLQTPEAAAGTPPGQIDPVPAAATTPAAASPAVASNPAVAPNPATIPPNPVTPASHASAGSQIPTSHVSGRGAVSAPVPSGAPAAVPATPMAPGVVPPGGSPGQVVAMPGAPAVAAPVANPASVVPTAAPVVPPSAVPPDPFADANAVWYVRHTSGGQYGPAKSDVMKRWMDEGRVSDDSLVWREGWEDWKRADEAFPQSPLIGASPPDASPVAAGGFAGLPAAEDAGRTSSSVAAANYYRRKSSNGRMIALTLLTVLVVILIPLLIWVLTQ